MIPSKFKCYVNIQMFIWLLPLCAFPDPNPKL